MLEFQQAGDNLKKNHNHKISLQTYVQLHPIILLYTTYYCVNPKQGKPAHSISQMLGQDFCVIFYTVCVLMKTTVTVQQEIICSIFILHQLSLLNSEYSFIHFPSGTTLNIT